MRGVVGFAAAAFVAAAFCGLACRASAQPSGIRYDELRDDGFLKPEPVEPLRDRDAARFLLYSSTDIWRHGAFASGGLLWAPSGLERDGPVLKLGLGGGVYRYQSGTLGEVRGELASASVLPGWRMVRDRLTVSVYLGYDYRYLHLTPDDPSTAQRGSRVGARAGAEVWFEPTRATMLTADGSVSTIGDSYNARFAAGVRPAELFYVGPEVQAFSAGTNYRQFRAGLHVTGLRAFNAEWSAGTGWAVDNDNRSGVYAKLGVFTRR